MTRLPSLPPNMPGDPVARRPRAAMADLQPAATGPVVANAPQRQVQPAQVPLGLSDKEGPASESDDRLIEDLLKDSNMLPTIVLLVSAALTLVIVAISGFQDGGSSSAAAFTLGGLMAMLVSCASASAAGWVVSKLFSEDFGSLGVMTLRFSAVAAAQFPVLGALYSILGLGFFAAMLFSLPVMIGVTIWVAGIDLFRSIVFCIILGVINLMLASIAVVSFVPSAVP